MEQIDLNKLFVEITAKAQQEEGKRKLTESSREFPKDSAWQRPEGSLREALKRMAMPPRSHLRQPEIGKRDRQLSEKQPVP